MSNMQLTFLFTGFIFIVGVSTYSSASYVGGLRGSLKECQEQSLSSVPLHCDLPNSNCAKYVENMKKWINISEKARASYLQCNLDLSRCQNELNLDTICIEPNCE